MHLHERNDAAGDGQSHLRRGGRRELPRASQEGSWPRRRFHTRRAPTHSLSRTTSAGAWRARSGRPPRPRARKPQAANASRSPVAQRFAMSTWIGLGTGQFLQAQVLAVYVFDPTGQWGEDGGVRLWRFEIVIQGFQPLRSAVLRLRGSGAYGEVTWGSASMVRPVRRMPRWINSPRSR
jgi:hypothetical protein